MGEVALFLEDLFVHPQSLLREQLMIYLADELQTDVGNVESMVYAAWVIYANSHDYDVVSGSPADGLDGALDSLLFDKLPAWATTGMTVAGDLTGIMNHLGVGGVMEIKHSYANGQIDGHWSWEDYLFIWRQSADGCDFDNACCGRHVFSGEEMGLQPVGSDFTGQWTPHVRAPGEQVVRYQQFDFSIDEHRLGLQYGNLVLFALNRFVLPGITGQEPGRDGLRCAVESLMGCDGSGQFVCGGPNIGTCGCDRLGTWLNSWASFIDAGVGATACRFAVDSVVDIAEERINELAWNGTDDHGLTVSVAGVISDGDNNLKGDFIDATMSGTVHRPDAITTFSATMTGDVARQECQADSDCGTDGRQTCQLTRGILDDCAARQVCLPKVGYSSGGARCTVDAQCASGKCLSNNFCFGACTDNLDCPGSRVCVVDGYTAELEPGVEVTVTSCGQ